MSSAEHSVAAPGRPLRAPYPRSRPAGAHRRVDPADTDPADLAERVRTTQRWTVGVLVLATVVLLGYVAAVVGAAWLVGSAVELVVGRELGDLDLLAVTADVAPVLLVGWCTGLATSAALARGEALGARARGLVAGAVGAVAGSAVLALALAL